MFILKAFMWPKWETVCKQCTCNWKLQAETLDLFKLHWTILWRILIHWQTPSINRLNATCLSVLCFLSLKTEAKESNESVDGNSIDHGQYFINQDHSGSTHLEKGWFIVQMRRIALLRESELTNTLWCIKMCRLHQLQIKSTKNIESLCFC